MLAAAAVALRNPPSSPARQISRWARKPNRCTFCSSVVAVVAGLAARLGLALYALAAVAAVERENANWC
jgi:hypothetical protein